MTEMREAVCRFISSPSSRLHRYHVREIWARAPHLQDHYTDENECRHRANFARGEKQAS